MRIILAIVFFFSLGCSANLSPTMRADIRSRTVAISTGMQVTAAYRSPNRIVTVKHAVKFGAAVVVVGPELLATIESVATLEIQDFNPTPIALPRYHADWVVFAPLGSNEPPQWGRWAKHGTNNGKVYISTLLGIASSRFVEEIWFHDSPKAMMLVDDDGQLWPGSSGSPVFDHEGRVLGLVMGRVAASGLVAVQPFRDVVEGNK